MYAIGIVTLLWVASRLVLMSIKLWILGRFVHLHLPIVRLDPPLLVWLMTLFLQNVQKDVHSCHLKIAILPYKMSSLPINPRWSPWGITQLQQVTQCMIWHLSQWPSPSQLNHRWGDSIEILYKVLDERFHELSLILPVKFVCGMDKVLGLHL